MAFFGLFRRRKKEGVRQPVSLSEGYKGYPQETFGGDKEMNLFGQPSSGANMNLQPTAFQQSNYNKDMDLILSKLDNIRAALENISRRLENLEKSVYGQQNTGYEQQIKRRW